MMNTTTTTTTTTTTPTTTTKVTYKPVLYHQPTKLEEICRKLVYYPLLAKLAKWKGICPFIPYPHQYQIKVTQKPTKANNYRKTSRRNSLPSRIYSSSTSITTTTTSSPPPTTNNNNNNIDLKVDFKVTTQKSALIYRNKISSKIDFNLSIKSR
ncbi:CLUMA_CG006053, isoform A [Clunio marinus]|uniref:CLUMA_CG006053, isoform A n=1 Tax=Clunio marinus TaxID=568069 RepID=A0A1J1HWP1_9DIPT|nr:CLUMA_CG006053, isoform A [Clunio marinus]